DRRDAGLCLERERAARQDRRGAHPAPGARRGSRSPCAAPDRGEPRQRAGPPQLMSHPAQALGAVTALGELPPSAPARCVERYGARLVLVPDGAPIPHSYWGAPEAGLAGGRVYARGDTPAHSLLHELCHYVCMTGARRAQLAPDARRGTPEAGAAVA